MCYRTFCIMGLLKKIKDIFYKTSKRNIVSDGDLDLISSNLKKSGEQYDPADFYNYNAPLPFKTYDEATAYFGIKFPKQFVDTLLTIDHFCQVNQLDTAETLFDIFGLLRIEGNEARYQQTPIELFPFGSTGSNGTHYGFIIHTIEEEDFPSGEICPIDDLGVDLIANNTAYLFQNLLCENSFLESHPDLFRQLNLTNTIIDRKLYDLNENILRETVKFKKDWRFLNTQDGAGVFAENKYFNTYHHTKYNFLNSKNGIEEYQNLANDMRKHGLYASQLYYLKELYWCEWTNYVIAKDLLTQMLEPYEKLNRPHLYEMTKWVIETFDQRYGG